MEGLAWDRTPAPPLGGLLVRIKGPGLDVLKANNWVSPFTWCRSALPWGTNSFNPHGQSVVVKMHIFGRKCNLFI